MKVALLIGSIVVLVGIALYLGACKKPRNYEAEVEAAELAAATERAPIVDNHRAAAKPRLAALRELGLDAKAAPPVTSREPLTLGEAIALTDKPDVVLVNLEHLLDPAWKNSAKIRVGTTTHADMIEPFMAKSDARFGVLSAENLETYFGMLAALQYVIVVREHAYQEPRGVGSIPGRLTGDAIVYRVEPRTRIGAFPFDVLQGDTVYRKSGNREEQLIEAFRKEAVSAVRDETVAYLASTAGPASAGTQVEERIATATRRFESTLNRTDFGIAGIRFFKISEANGKPLVTLHVGRPAEWTGEDGAVKPEILAKITAVLGEEPQVTVVKGAGPAPTEP